MVKVSTFVKKYGAGLEARYQMNNNGLAVMVTVVHHGKRRAFDLPVQGEEAKSLLLAFGASRYQVEGFA